MVALGYVDLIFKGITENRMPDIDNFFDIEFDVNNLGANEVAQDLGGCATRSSTFQSPSILQVPCSRYHMALPRRLDQKENFPLDERT